MNINLYPEAEYEVWICDGLGRRVHLLDTFQSLHFSRALGSVGRFQLVIASDQIPSHLLTFDNVIQIWRKPIGGISSLVFGGFTRVTEYFESSSLDMVRLEGEDGISLLEKRINAYQSDTDYSDIYGEPADDLQKLLVRQNMGNGTGAVGTDRDLTAYGFEVEIDQGLVSTTDVAVSFANLLEALNSISQYALEIGEPLFFDLIPTVFPTYTGWKFFNRVGQLGSNRGTDSKIPMIFSKESGNLENPMLRFSAEDEATVIYAGGRGGGQHRRIQTAIDSNRRYRTPWSRKEVFINFRKEKGITSLSNKALSELQAHEPKIFFSGNLKDTPQSRYGVEWNFGDKVVVVYQNFVLDSWINAIRFGVNSEGKETIDARVEFYS